LIELINLAYPKINDESKEKEKQSKTKEKKEGENKTVG